MEDWLKAAAGARPGHPAIVADDGTATYAELDAAADRAARRMAALGVGEGNRVATSLPAGLAFVELLHALPRLGAAFVPLDPRVGDAERRPFVEASRAKLVVDEPPTGEEEDVELAYDHDPASVHSVVFTSGTTGEPVGVELTHANHLASARASAANLGVEPGDRWLAPLPLFHVGGLSVLLRSVISATTAVSHDGFTPERVKAALETGDATIVSLVATMLQRVRAAGLERAPALRAALLGGGPIPPLLLDWADEIGLPAVPSYGMTETASQIAAAKPGDRCARALRDARIRVERSGEILVQGPMVAECALARDGWLHTGDRGRLDADGCLHVEGRMDDVIVTGGENVVPIRVERALADHPAVAEVGVVGVPDPDWGEAVTAFVVLSEPATDDELIAHTRERVAPQEVPKRIERLEALPRTPLGKLRRRALADR